MNKAKYDSLPADLKKVIDANSGIGLSAQIGRTFREGDVTGKKTIAAESINVISREEIENWKIAAQPVIDGWVKDVSDKGVDGKALLEGARALIAKYGK